jgi:hypothetical protein
MEVITSSPGNARSLPVPTRKPAGWDKKTGKQEDDDVVDVKKRRRQRDDDDVVDERPSRRRNGRKRQASYATPHRGGMILAFGIIAIVSGLGLIFGPIAWVMGNNDLREMESGAMDPEGESMTQIGRILGMIATILSIVAVLIGCGIFVVYFVFIILIFGAVAAGAANANNRNFPQPRR